jgi:DNA-directed RNA polymerase subunit RPC12/RpoP
MMKQIIHDMECLRCGHRFITLMPSTCNNCSHKYLIDWGFKKEDNI